jgi:O-acetyl-ADP-ribose deacetylase (regulator of RNase III)
MNHYFSVSHGLPFDLAIVLALFTVFAWCVRRGVLNAKEMLWIGAAMGFFATSLTFNSVLISNRLIYGVGSIRSLLGITALMMIPLVAALVYGIAALYRSVAEKELAVLTVENTTLRLVFGNIAALKREDPLDALIIPANTDLRMGAGVARTLKTFGGGAIEKEARAKAPIQIGQAVATCAGSLPARYVIHAAITERDRKTDIKKIDLALGGALKCAKTIGARRIALSAFGIGIGKNHAIAVAPMTVQAALRAHKDFDEIVIVVFNNPAASVFLAEFAALAEKYPFGDSPTHPVKPFLG